MKTSRFIKAEDGAFYWSYWLPLEPVTKPVPIKEIKGEDVSHGSLSMSVLAEINSQVDFLTPMEKDRLTKTVTKGFARLNNGILFGSVNGEPNSNPAYVQLPARWLILTPYSEEVYQRISRFYLNYVQSPGPLDLALLIRYMPK